MYAPTFPGYGRSEKQALAYSQELWRDFLRDFVLEVVGRPVVVAGNSIGGFISASLAADYPSLVKGESTHQDASLLCSALFWHPLLVQGESTCEEVSLLCVYPCATLRGPAKWSCYLAANHPLLVKGGSTCQEVPLVYVTRVQHSKAELS